MNQKGVGPVVATVIIVAVTIAIAIAVAYWIGGLATIFTRYPAWNPTNSTQTDNETETYTIYVGHDFLVIDTWQFNGVLNSGYIDNLVIGTTKGEIIMHIHNEDILTFNYAQYYWKIRIIAFGSDFITYQVLETNVER